MADLTNCISAVQHVRMSDGSFAAVFPINTTNEVYYNIDAGIKLDDYYSAMVNPATYTVQTEEERLTFTSLLAEDLTGKTLLVRDTGKKYIIIDESKLGSNNAEAAYSELPSIEGGTHIPTANHIAKYDGNARLHSTIPTSGTEVATYEFLDSKRFLYADGLIAVEDVNDVIDADTLNGLTADDLVTSDELKTISVIETNGAISSVKADTIYNKVNTINLPDDVFSKCVIVENDAERFSLTKYMVQAGDVVIVRSTSKTYFVVNTALLYTVNGYEEFTISEAVNVAWSGITDKPRTLADYGIESELTNELNETAPNYNYGTTELSPGASGLNTGILNISYI